MTWQIFGTEHLMYGNGSGTTQQTATGQVRDAFIYLDRDIAQLHNAAKAVQLHVLSEASQKDIAIAKEALKRIIREMNLVRLRDQHENTIKEAKGIAMAIKELEDEDV